MSGSGFRIFIHLFMCISMLPDSRRRVAVADRILRGESGALEGYRRFLSSGCTMPPIELLKLAGVDMASPEPVNAALKVFETLLDEWESLSEEA